MDHILATLESGTDSAFYKCSSHVEHFQSFTWDICEEMRKLGRSWSKSIIKICLELIKLGQFSLYGDFNRKE